MATSLTFDLDFLPSRRAQAEAARVIAARPPIPKPRTLRRPVVVHSTPPVRGFIGELVWAVLLMLTLAVSVRVMLVFAALQAPVVHVDESITHAQPAGAAAERATPRQPSSEAAIRTI
jgi:hypothetical protein